MAALPDVTSSAAAAANASLIKLKPPDNDKRPWYRLGSVKTKANCNRKIMALIATAIANGSLLPHNRHSPLAARRVFETLKEACLMHCVEDRLN